MKHTFKKSLSIILAAAILICSAPLAGLVGVELPNIYKLISKAVNNEIPSYHIFQTERYIDLFGNVFMNGEGDSFARTYYEEMQNDKTLLNMVSAWEGVHVATEPSHAFDSGRISKSDFYQAILFDMFNTSTDSALASQFEEAYSEYYGMIKNDHTESVVSFAKQIAEMEEIPVSELKSFTVEDATKYSFLCEGVGTADEVLSLLGTCKDVYEVINKTADYMFLVNLRDGTKEVLTAIAADMNNPYEIRKAATDFALCIENGYQNTMTALINGAVEGFEIASKKFFDKAWESLADMVPMVKAVFEGAKCGRALCNYLFSTDKLVKGYFTIEASVLLEDAVMRAVNTMKNKYNSSKSDENAKNYMRAIDMYRNIVLLGFDYSIDLLETSANSEVNSTLTFIGNYNECINNINAINSFKSTKINSFNRFEALIFNRYNELYCNDFEETLTDYNNQYIPVESISLKQIKGIEAGTSGYISEYVTVSILPQNYTEAVCTSWTSSDETILNFKNSGIVDLGEFTALKEGTVTLTCTTSGGVSGSIDVVVGTENPEEPVVPDFKSDFEYVVNEDGVTATITGYNGTNTRVIIPEVINGYTINAIGKKAFLYDRSIISVTIPDSVTIIDEEAFYYAENLTSVIIPDSISIIADRAFGACFNLTGVTLPDSIISIGDSAFSSTNITSISIPKGIKEIANTVFASTELLTVKIPDGVTSIGEHAFANCENLTSILIPNSVTSIGEGAFNCCYNLVNMSIPDGVSNIDDYTFYRCYSLEKVSIPDSVISIGEHAFDECYSLTSISIPDSVTNVGSLAFDECSSLKSIVVGDGLLNFNGFQFNDYIDLEEIVIGEGITYISKRQFSGCINLNKVSIGSGVTTIEEDAFKDCTSLTDVYYAGDISQWCSIKFNKYYGNPMVFAKNLYINGKLIDELIIPDNVTHIGDYAFLNCSQFTSITIPDSVTHIGYRAFWGCSNFSSIEIGDGLTSLDNIYFDDNINLKKVVIGNAITSIGYCGFLGCTGLTDITISNSVKSIEDRAFKDCSNLADIMIPDSVENIGDLVFSGCKSLVNVIIGNGVKIIGDNVFEGCTALTDIYYNGSQDEWNDIAISSNNAELKNITIHFIDDEVPVETHTAYFYLSDDDYFDGNYWYKTETVCGEEIEFPDAPEIDGSWFVCWDNDATVMGSEDMHFVAITERIEYYIEFLDIYGNPIDGADWFAYWGDEISEEDAPVAEEINGYEFAGWYDENGNKYRFPVTVYSDLTFYAEYNEVEVHEHSYTSFVATPATCTESGVMTYTCECGDSYTEIISPQGHRDEGKGYTYKVPSCVEEGRFAVLCEDCKRFLRFIDIPAIGHTPGEWIVTTEPTEFIVGIETQYCLVCGEVIATRAIGTLEHTHVPKTITIPASCMVPGMEYDICETCGETLGEARVIPATGHTEGEWEITTPATCTENGEKIKKCTVCGEICVTETIPANGHISKTITIPASCTVPGMEYDICETCGETLGEARVIPATGHTEGEWSVSIEPTCVDEGEKICHCSVCGQVCAAEAIPAKGHVPGEWETVLEPTAETEGKKIRRCTVCGETVEEEIIPKKTVVTDEESGVSIVVNSDEYDGEVDIIVEESFDGAAFNLVNTQTGAAQSFIYDIRMTVDGEEVQPSGKLTVRIPLPANYDPARSFVYHVDTATGKVEKMPARYENGYLVFETTHFSYYAVVDTSVTLKGEIRNPSITTITYGDSIILHADINAELPAGYYVEWTANNGNFSYVASEDTLTCTVTPVSSGKTIFTATVYDANGNPVSTDEQEMTSKAGFFQKIIAFFKKLFRMTKTYPDVFKF